MSIEIIVVDNDSTDSTAKVALSLGAKVIKESQHNVAKVRTDYRPNRYSVKLYLQLWRLLGKITGMAQGSAQFCRKDIYVSLRGYDETLYMGEDVDFLLALESICEAA